MTKGVVLITGASRGLGRKLADKFLFDDWLVIGLARSPLQTWVGEEHPHFERYVCDITDESMVKRFFSSLRKQYGQLDVLINNAGIFSGDLLLSATSDRYSDLFLANVVSAQLITREASKIMRFKGGGRVISISSIAVDIPITGNTLYASTKSALECLMRGYAVEFKGSGITFNSVAISFVENTGMLDSLKPAARELYESRLLESAPLKIDEIMHVLCFLISDHSRPVNGQTISLGSPF